MSKNTPPDKLPPEFFGLMRDFEERQRINMREHFFDPLKGLLVVPEEEHTYLGKIATEKPGITPEKWKKEEYK